MTDSRALILAHALPLVPFDGWTEYTLRKAGTKAGLCLSEVKRAFLSGPADLIDYFFQQGDEAMAYGHSPESLALLRVPDRITMLVLARLTYFAPHKEALRRAIANYALPWNLFRASKALYRTLNHAWHLAGDTATDFNFYTKRAILAGVYSTTLLYWLNDNSANMENTERFLQRRLSSVVKLGSKKRKL